MNFSRSLGRLLTVTDSWCRMFAAGCARIFPTVDGFPLTITWWNPDFSPSVRSIDDPDLRDANQIVPLRASMGRPAVLEGDEYLRIIRVLVMASDSAPVPIFMFALLECVGAVHF